MKTKLVSVLLVAVVLFSIFTNIIYAKTEEPVAVTLSMYSNLQPNQNSISGLYKNNVFYVTIDDLCKISGAETINSSEKSVSFSISKGVREFVLDVPGNTMKDVLYNDSYYVTMPALVENGTVYVSALHFLRYIGASIKLVKDSKIQFMVAVRYSIYDALMEYSDTNLGNFFWWDEVDYDGKSVEGKLINAGVVALINRESNVFRMMFDPKGIEREALEDALVSIITNEGAQYFDDASSPFSTFHLLSDTIGVEASVVDFITDVYKSGATKDFGKFIDEFSESSDVTMGTISNVIDAAERYWQFDSITETQRTLLENTIIKYPSDSLTLVDGWENVLNAAKNVDARAKDAHKNNFEAASDLMQSTIYDFVENATGGNPVSFAWNSVILINKWIPYTSNMIENKDKLYNAYNCSMIQLIANEMLCEAYSRLYYNSFIYEQPTKQIDLLKRVKNNLILQLKSTLRNSTKIS